MGLMAVACQLIGSRSPTVTFQAEYASIVKLGFGMVAAHDSFFCTKELFKSVGLLKGQIATRRRNLVALQSTHGIYSVAISISPRRHLLAEFCSCIASGRTSFLWNVFFLPKIFQPVVSDLNANC